MLEQDTKNEVSPIRRESSDETGKDPLRFTPSKRIFLRETLRKDKTHQNESVSWLKSNSKILKKKRHKDKLKFFKLDKNLWDPTIPIPLLGKSGKYVKKKDKLAANAQMGGSRIPGREKTSCAEKANQMWPFNQSKPLEDTFDILCLAANHSHPSIMKEPEDTNQPLGKDFLTMSSNVPVQNVDVANKLFLGDLIDLGTPNTFNSKVHHHYSQLCELPVDAVNEKDEVSYSSYSNPQQSSFNPLPINSKEPCGSNVDASMQTHNINEVRSLGSGVEVEEQSAHSSALIMRDHSDSAQEKSHFVLDDQLLSRNSEISQPIYNTSSGERGSSPVVFYGFPCLKLPEDKIKKQQLLATKHSRQMLIDHLNKDPFPKVVREIAKLHVRRRAFSMDDTLMARLPGRPLEKIGPDTSVEFDKAEVTSNEEAPCTLTSESNNSSLKLSELIEVMKRPPVEGESGSITPSNCEERCSNSSEIVLNYSTECLKDTTLESNSNIDIGEDKGFNIHSNMPPSTENHSISEREPGVDRCELSDDNISKEKCDSTISENSLDSPLTAEKCENVPGKIEGSEGIDNYEPTPDLASDNTPQAYQSSPLPNNLNSMKKLCDVPDENKLSTLTITNTEELGNRRTSILQQHVSSDQDIKTSLNITMYDLPNNVNQETSDSIVSTSEMGLRVNMEGEENRDIPSYKSLDQTPILFLPDDEKEHSEDLATKAPEFHLTNPKRLDADDNISVMNEDRCQKTSITVGIGLSSPEHSSGNLEESNIDGDWEQNLEYSSISMSTVGKDQSTGSKKSEENIAEVITTPTKEIATPASAIFEQSNVDSSFGDESCMTPLEHWVLPPGKKFRRSLSIIRNLDEHPSACARRGRHYEKSVEEIIRLQGNVEATTPVQSLRKRLSKRRSSWMRQITPPRVRRSTFIWSPTITDRGTLYETPRPRKSFYSTPMQQNLVRRTSVRTSPLLGTRRSVRPPFKQECAPASPVQYTIRDLILTICKQTEPCSFFDILSEKSYERGCKIGEGVFGEVFSITRDDENTVLKIIPIEGQQLVNGEKQKTYQEVLSELVIAKVLDELRYEGSDELNLTSGYAEVIATSLVQDSYPEPLIKFWEEFDRTKGSDNENPKLFDKEQLFIVMEQGNGGKDLESYTFSSARQSLSIFKQIAFSLAVAEISVEFEHRDLHWGNVLVSKTTEKQIFYILNGTQYSVASNGVKCTIIDYTLSRIKYINQVPIYNDIGKDPEMFIATGDYQFDIYRFMKKDVEDDWSRFAPKTNARWLHYLLDKMLTKVKYQRKTAKVHKDSFKVLEEINKWVEGCGSALSVALRLAELKH